MDLRKFVPGLLALLVTLGEVFVSYSFLMANVRAPGTPFVRALLLSVTGIMMGVMALIVSVPRVKVYLVEEKISPRNYWLVYGFLLLASMGLGGWAVMTGSIEYTQYQASLN